MPLKHPELPQDIYLEIAITGYRNGQIWQPITLGSPNQTKETYDMITKLLSDTMHQLGVTVRDEQGSATPTAGGKP